MLKLVYGCLAFSLVACVILFVAAASTDGDGFHGMTNAMGNAIASNATVLDADAHGAVTQTGNGRITGYARTGESAWSTEFDPFAQGPDNPYGAGAIDAHAWCTLGCPDAIVEISRKYSSYGMAGRGLASTLTKLGLGHEAVLSIQGVNGALVAVPSARTGKTQLRAVLHLKSSALPITNPTTASVGAGELADKAIVGSARGNRGSATRLFWDNGQEWKIEEPAIREASLKNVCISFTGMRVGTVATRVRYAEFFGSPGPALGPALSSGTCSVDAKGITAIYTPTAKPASLEVTRYSNNGKRLWHYSFGGQRLLSKSSFRYVVAQAPDGTVTAIDAESGRKMYSGHVTGVPFVAQDGSIVTADRSGNPRWLLVGKSLTDPTYQ